MNATLLCPGTACSQLPFTLRCRNNPKIKSRAACSSTVALRIEYFMELIVRDDCFPSLRTVHYLMTKRPDKVVAHCLDLDIVATGATDAMAVKRLNSLVGAHIAMAVATGNVVLLTHKAPDEYWNRWNRCTHVSKGTFEVKFREPVPAVGEIGVVEAACAALA